MIANLEFPSMTPQKYLEWEPIQEMRYEYFNGEVVAMTGGTKPHNRIALNLAIALDNQLRDGNCEVYITDIKVVIPTRGNYFYPDLVVTCDLRDRNNNQLINYPTLIIELLSPSTEVFDRSEKFAQYRTIETLQEYVLIHSQRISVEVFQRNEQNLWVLHPYESGDTVTLASVGLSLPIQEIYRQVDLDFSELSSEA
ncbi:MAG: Uma2 family endonuclease [Oscillatoria sp. PMC 1051.18]|nr:Uma2 family endonuclease [Oscillatoria sp. PMC 1050.18]MEC5030023.1 Uma2 family endonuclease [Oscillatoria sp. PMC 1051.18]